MISLLLIFGFRYPDNLRNIVQQCATFAQNRPKSDIIGALGPTHDITLKAFAKDQTFYVNFWQPSLMLDMEYYVYVSYL